MTQWTEGRIRAFIVAVLRSGSRRWPPKYQTLNAAKTEKKINKATGRLAQHYKCNGCKKEFTSKDIQIDHIVPVTSAEGFTTWDNYIERLFCDESNLQALCLTCHKIKSKKESSGRKKNPKE